MGCMGEWDMATWAMQCNQGPRLKGYTNALAGSGPHEGCLDDQGLTKMGYARFLAKIRFYNLLYDFYGFF
jgi:hypothetical protein